jgi:host factor-I protein
MLPDPRFIQWLAKYQEPVTVFLTNGVKLSGLITNYFQGQFFLSRDGETQLVFIHAVGTIMPANGIAAEDIPEIMEEMRKAERGGQ